MKEYEKRSKRNATTLQAQRQLCTGERAKTLHIYMLCSLPGVRFHLRVVAVHPDQSRDTRKEEDLLYDHTLTESALTILLGTIMSAEDQTAYNSPIRWMAMSSAWGSESPTLNCRVSYLLLSDMEQIEQHLAATLRARRLCPLTTTTSATFSAPERPACNPPA
jgi:hypothetical protein